jgi:hypothetical protein
MLVQVERQGTKNSVDSKLAKERTTLTVKHLSRAARSLFSTMNSENLNADFRLNPHVILQHSWTDDIAEEALAVDDMMHHAGVGEYNGLGRPNAAYLIKALIRGKESNSPVYGFDIFVDGQDGTTPEEPTMRAGGCRDQYRPSSHRIG